MITRFSTLSDAAVFASRLRDEGHFAEIIHLNAAHLWGPHPAWGIPVVHSEPEAAELDELPEEEGSWHRLKTLVLGVPLLCGLLVVASYAALIVEPLRERLGNVPALASIALLTALIAVLFVKGLTEESSEDDAESSDDLRWLPESANRTCGVILSMIAVVGAALAVFIVLGFLAAMASAPLLGLTVLLALAGLAGVTALGHFVVRAHRDPRPDLHSATVVACQGIIWSLFLLLLF